MNFLKIFLFCLISFKPLHSNINLYVACGTAVGAPDSPPPGRLDVIDTENETVIASLLIGHDANGLSISADGSLVYIASSTLISQKETVGSVPDGTILTFDTLSNTVTGTFTQTNRFISNALTPDGTTLYVPNSETTTLNVIDTASNTLISTWTVGDDPWGIAVSPNGQTVYVVNTTSNSVSVINALTGETLQEIILDSNPSYIVLNSAGTVAYVTGPADNRIYVLDLQINAITNTISVDANPGAPALTPDGSFLYVPCSDTIDVIDTQNNSVSQTIYGAGSFSAITFHPNGTTAYIANFSEDTVDILDVASGMITTSIPVSNQPRALVTTPAPGAALHKSGGARWQ